MSAAITIRSYLATDFNDLIATLKEGGNYSALRDTDHNYRVKIQKDSNSILVAELNGKLIGCVFTVSDGWASFIFRLAVREEFRKKGIGIQLMLAAEKQLREKGMKESVVFVDSDAERLKDWYSKQGYSLLGKRDALQKKFK